MSDRTAEATAVICTRNRGDQIVATLDSIYAGDVVPAEVLVIDQSTDGVTADAIRGFLDRPGFRYVHTDEIGVSKSRNRGAFEASHEFLLMTDDDCTVDPGWAAAHIELLQMPHVGMVFGDVLDAVCDPSVYTPVSIAEADFTVTRLQEWRPTDQINVGIGASCAARRSAVLGIGGFDEQLGPGSPFRNGEDTDLSCRLVHAGHHIHRTTRAPVLHFGARTPEEFRVIARASMLSTGAICAKLLRVDPMAGARFGLLMLWGAIVLPGATALVRRRRPPVLGRASYFARGLWRGLRRPLDRATLRFVDADQQYAAMPSSSGTVTNS